MSSAGRLPLTGQGDCGGTSMWCDRHRRVYYICVQLGPKRPTGFPQDSMTVGGVVGSVVQDQMEQLPLAHSALLRQICAPISPAPGGQVAPGWQVSVATGSLPGDTNVALRQQICPPVQSPDSSQ
jgi:hypothetical protein